MDDLDETYFSCQTRLLSALIKPALVSIDVRHPEEDPGEDDGVEDSHQGDAEDNPQRDEGNLPGPGDYAEITRVRQTVQHGVTSHLSSLRARNTN